MTAKEMFEEWGFYEKDEFPNIITYHKESSDGVYELLGIEFVLNHHCISMYRKIGNKFNYGAFNGIDKKLLKAINKQVEELGWNNE